jgi:hypothetical protein
VPDVCMRKLRKERTWSLYIRLLKGIEEAFQGHVVCLSLLICEDLSEDCILHDLASDPSSRRYLLDKSDLTTKGIDISVAFYTLS